MYSRSSMLKISEFQSFKLSKVQQLTKIDVRCFILQCQNLQVPTFECPKLHNIIIANYQSPKFQKGYARVPFCKL